MSNFSLSIKKFKDFSDKKMETVFRQTAFKLSSAIIKNTPFDTGRARNNWFPDINKFYDSMTEEIDKTGAKAIENVKSVTSKIKIGQTFTLSNNLDYIEKLEYIEGYSKQQPRGMVRINLLKFQLFLNEANKEQK